MYAFIQGIAFTAYLVIFVLVGPRYNMSRVKSLILGIVTMAADLMLVKVVAWIAAGFQEFGAENMIRVYVFAPVVFYAMAKIGRVDPLKFFDAQAIVGPLAYGLGHYACIFTGCCHGFSYYEGTPMYNIAYALTQTDKLPLQFLESTAAVLVFVLCYSIAVKKQYATNGRLLSIWFVVFGTQRFLWEFLRDNKKIIVFAPLKQADGYFGISNLAIWALLMVMAGVIVYVRICRAEDKEKQQTSSPA